MFLPGGRYQCARWRLAHDLRERSRPRHVSSAGRRTPPSGNGRSAGGAEREPCPDRMKQLLKSAFGRLGYRIQGTRYSPRHLFAPACLRSLELDDVVCRRMFEAGAALSFIPGRAVDGITPDPLPKYIQPNGGRRVLVEPPPESAPQPRAPHPGNSGLVRLQAAVYP